MIAHLKIPNGIPLVYTMDENLEPIDDLTDDLGFQANYLVSARNHGKVRLHSWVYNIQHYNEISTKRFIRVYTSEHSPHLNTRTYLQMMEYERCVRKKLRSLFEYLDTDKDGRITPTCLQSGLIRLQNYSTGVGVCTPNPAAPQICEYEIEELLRAVPRWISFTMLCDCFELLHSVHCIECATVVGDVFLKIMAPGNSLTFHSIHFHSFFPCHPLPLLYLPVPPYSFPYFSYTLHLPYLFSSLSLLILCLLPPLPPQCWWAWRCYPEGIPWFRGYTASKTVKTATPPVE
jgi:hypothetical protein